MAPIVIPESSSSDLPDDPIAPSKKSPERGNVAKEIMSYGNVVVLPDVIPNKNEIEARNEGEIEISTSQEDEERDDDDVNPEQTSNLFADELVDNDDVIDWDKTSQSNQGSNSPNSVVSNLMASSRSFEFPSINTSFMGRSGGESSPRVAVPSPSVFFSNANISSSLKSTKKKIVDGLFSPSSSEMVDVDLLAEESGPSNEGQLTDKPNQSSLRELVGKKAETKKASSASIFGLEPLRWETKKGFVSTSKNEDAGTSWFTTFDTTQISNSFKKWSKDFTAAASEFLNEDESKDAFVAHFGRQVSRQAAESMYDDCRNVV